MKSHVTLSSAAFRRPSLQRLGLLTAVATVLLTGCASSRLPPAPALAATDSYNYLIGPGDTINIIVWRNPELSISVPVRPDGKISTPLVEDLIAIGRDSTSLAREIEQELSKVIREPVVTVIVSDFVGPYSQQVRVVGEAARPQALPYVQQMTLLDVMIAVGGLTEYAAGNRATILRIPPVVKATSDTEDAQDEDAKAGNDPVTDPPHEDSTPLRDETPVATTAKEEAPVATASLAVAPAARPVAAAVSPAPARLSAAPSASAAPASTDVKTVIDKNMAEPEPAAAAVTVKAPATKQEPVRAVLPVEDKESEEGKKHPADSAGAEDAADVDEPTPQVAPKPQQYSVRLNDLMKEGDVSANVEMLPGDILIIPQSWF